MTIRWFVFHQHYLPGQTSREQFYRHLRVVPHLYDDDCSGGCRDGDDGVEFENHCRCVDGTTDGDLSTPFRHLDFLYLRRFRCRFFQCPDLFPFGELHLLRVPTLFRLPLSCGCVVDVLDDVHGAGDFARRHYDDDYDGGRV